MEFFAPHKPSSKTLLTYDLIRVSRMMTSIVQSCTDRLFHIENFTVLYHYTLLHRNQECFGSSHQQLKAPLMLFCYILYNTARPRNQRNLNILAFFFVLNLYTYSEAYFRGIYRPVIQMQLTLGCSFFFSSLFFSSSSFEGFPVVAFFIRLLKKASVHIKWNNLTIYKSIYS